MTLWLRVVPTHIGHKSLFGLLAISVNLQKNDINVSTAPLIPITESQ